jgi:chromosome segregation ATPase
MLISILTLSLKSFSQKDTTQLEISTQTARLIIKDLIRYDGCKDELTQAYIKIGKLEERESLKDTMITYLEKKDSTYQFIIKEKDGQIVQYENIKTKLEKDLTAREKQFKWYKRGTIAGGVFLIILLLTI